MRKTKMITFAIATALLMPALAAAQEDDGGLLLDKNTMQLGGMVGFDVTTYVIEGEDEHTSAMLVLAPQFGYFVADHLELLGRFGVSTQLADEEWYSERGETAIDFGLGIQYFAGDGPCAYFGAQAGMEFWNVEDEAYKWFNVTVPVGALIPLNQHVAVDVGARFSALISLEDDDVAVLEVPMGFLGVQGFF